MGFIDKGLGAYSSVGLGAAITVGAGGAESMRVTPPYNIPASTLQTKNITERFGPNETWVPVGIAYVVTTGITGSAATITLVKNGVNAATGGTLQTPVAGTGPNEIFAPFTAWTFAAGDAIGDVWSIKPTTLSTLGAITARLIYAVRVVPGIAVGVPY